MGATKKMTVMKLRDPHTGNICKSPEENGQVLKKHFEALYAKESKFDLSVLNDMRQREIHPNMDSVPTAEEVSRHCLRAKSGRAPGDSLFPTELAVLNFDTAVMDTPRIVNSAIRAQLVSQIK